MPKELLLLLVVALVGLFALAALKSRGRGKALHEVRARRLLTDREQPMFHRLQQAFPDDIVLTQVAFSALLTAKDLPSRATFNRKVADFVVASKAFEVLAVIELDDASHRGRESLDGQRDELLERAGYRVLRFKTVPDAEVVRRAVRRAVEPPAQAQQAARQLQESA